MQKEEQNRVKIDYSLYLFSYTSVMLEKNYLTKEGYEKLIEELKGLKEKLPQVLERIKEAVQQGDLSENAEYSTAVDEKNFIETTIGDIESSLKNVEIIKEGGKQKG